MQNGLAYANLKQKDCNCLRAPKMALRLIETLDLLHNFFITFIQKIIAYKSWSKD